MLNRPQDVVTRYALNSVDCSLRQVLPRKESTVRYLGIEVDDAIDIAAQNDT